MVLQTGWLLLGNSPGVSFIAFVFFATVCSYSFHWYLTQDMPGSSSRLVWLRENRRIHTIFFFIGLAGVIVTGLTLLDHWKWLLLSAFITFLYSAPMIPHPWFRALRKIALGKTIFLAGVWMYVTTILPLLVSGEDWRSDFTLFSLSRFFLIYAICVLFDYRDREYDRKLGIRSLITWLSERAVTILFISSLCLFTLLTAGLMVFDYSRLDLLLLLIPGIVTAFLYGHATRNAGDLLFYLVLDGLMALSAFLMLFERLK